MMQIDPTKWPKVEGDRITKEGVYFSVGKHGQVGAGWYSNQQLIYRQHHTYYGPIEFVPPKVIPPKPTLNIVLVERTAANDSHSVKTGDMRWAILKKDGDYLTLDDDGNPGAIWIASRTKEVYLND